MFKSLLQRFSGAGAAEGGTVQPRVPQLSEEEFRHILRQARKLHAEKRHDDCTEILAPLIEAYPEDGETHLLLGCSLYAGGNITGAAGILIKAVELGFGDSAIYAMIASGLSGVGNSSLALSYALRAYEGRKTDPEICVIVAQLYLRQEAYESAAEYYSKALELAPRDKTALFGLVDTNIRGQVALRKSLMSDHAMQIKRLCLKRALADVRRQRRMDDKEIFDLILLAYGEKKTFNETAIPFAEELYGRQSIDGPMAMALAHVFVRLGDRLRAIEMLEFCRQEVSSSNLLPTMSLGQAYISAGGKQWREGWKIFDETMLQFFTSRRVESVPLWQGERLGKKRLFVYQEQGFGDVLLGLRLLRLLQDKGIDCVFWVNKGLGELVKTAGCIDEVVEAAVKPDPRDHGCVVATPLFSLIRHLKLEPKDLKTRIPVVAALPGRCESWRERILAQNGVRVGLVATGNPWRSDDWTRSVELDELEPLKAIHGVTWVSLAVDDRPERNGIVTAFGALDPAPELHDFADTAAIIDVLDIVVAIDCSVAHLAAAMGKPVLVLAPIGLDWRWRIGDDSQPWWPNARAFFSSAPGRFDSAVTELAGALREFVQARVTDRGSK